MKSASSVTHTDTTAPSHAVPLQRTGTQPRKFVHVLERLDNGLVKFEFAVGWPDLACELVLPAPLFETFCETHGVEFLAEPLATPFPLEGHEA